MPGPIIFPATTSVALSISGTSLTAIRRELAPRVGPFSLIQTTGAPLGPDSLRSIISTSLRDPASKRTKFDSRYAYVTTGDNAGLGSKVFGGGYDGNAGTVMTSVPFAAELLIGTTVELLEPVPAVTDGDLFGLNDAIRTALWDLRFYQDYPLTYVSQQVRYGLTGLPFEPRLDELEDVICPIASGQTSAQTIPYAIDRGSWTLRYDADSPYLLLRHGFNNGDTFYLRWRRPAATWVKSGGVWSSSDTGPTAESDCVVYDARTVAMAALPIVLERLVEYYRGKSDQANVQKYAGRLMETRARGAVTRLFRGFRTDGVQRVGARRGGRGVWGSKGWGSHLW